MYTGFYLNLAANKIRKDALVNRLQAVGGASRYQRVEAIDGRKVAHQYATKLDPGNLGLWISHVDLVRAQLDSPLHLHILEDDTTLANNAIQLFDQVLSHADTNIRDWDIIFTDVAVSLDSQLFTMLSGTLGQFQKNGLMTLAPLNRIQFAGTGSIFLRRESLAKYLSLMDQGWNEGLPIDLFLQKLVSLGKLKAYLTLPFLTSPTPHGEQSDIRGALPPSRLVMDLYRRAFFKDADLNGINEQLKRLLIGARVSTLSTIFLNATAFVFSDKWEAF